MVPLDAGDSYLRIEDLVGRYNTITIRRELRISYSPLHEEMFIRASFCALTATPRTTAHFFEIVREKPTNAFSFHLAFAAP
jgi:hypothetical protein